MTRAEVVARECLEKFDTTKKAIVFGACYVGAAALVNIASNPYVINATYVAAGYAVDAAHLAEHSAVISAHAAEGCMTGVTHATGYAIHTAISTVAAHCIVSSGAFMFGSMSKLAHNAAILKLRANVDAAQIKYGSADAQWQTAYAQKLAAEEQLKSVNVQYEFAKVRLESTKEQLNSAVAQWESADAQHESAKIQFQAAQIQLQFATTELQESESQLLHAQAKLKENTPFVSFIKNKFRNAI